jgi:purine-binding chemotaxis protein CheW
MGIETKAGGGGKYLTFQLSKETYGMEILKVREIVGLLDITAVPQSAAYVRGVVNLRGKIIPVIDLRRKFGLPEAEFTKQTCIITTQVVGKGGDLLVGLLVDAVHEVVSVDGGDVEPIPDVGDDIQAAFILGLAKTKGKVSILLDIEKVVGGGDLSHVEALEKAIAGAA